MSSHPDIVSKEARKGRAALTQRVGRFEQHAREAVDDGWDIPEETQVLRTELAFEDARSIIARNSSPDLYFDRSINPYRGCEHGCIYCFARPTHAYLGLSPGLDFETKLVAKPGAPELLERALSRKGYRAKPLAIGTNTDPYQPVEKDQQIMRRCLEVLERFNHPVAVVTKGTLIERDGDILGRMGRKGLARVGISVTTLDRHLARKLEPRVPPPARRLQTITHLTQAGCPVRVMAAPMIPGLTDHELEAILAAGAKAGATAASYIMLRLPLEVVDLFQEWLAEHYPDRAGKVMRAVRALHGGKDYMPEFGSRMTGKGLEAELFGKRFKLALKRNGLESRLHPMRDDLFAVPPKPGDQLSLF